MGKKDFKGWMVIFLAVISLAFLGAACDIEDPDPDPDPDTESTYVGSKACESCHKAIYDDFIESGHPYKFNIVDGAAPTYPSFVENFMELPMGADSWDDIAGVIGGFGWKARFVDTTGMVVGTAESIINTGGGQNQLNFFPLYEEKGTFSDYHASDVKQYNYSCFKCHTTGGVDAEETEKNWIVEHLGIENDEPLGYFEFGGIQCEACHGMGSKHASSIDPVDIDRPEGNDITELCGRCHTRDAERRVEASGEFIKHHEQYDEFIKTTHYKTAGNTCSTCHDPHKRVRWDGDGIIKECEDCHSEQVAASPHGDVECVTCHMPRAAKSAQQIAFKMGDVRSHTFSISTDPEWPMFEEADDGKLILVEDDDGLTHLNLEYVCYQCHTNENGEGGTKGPADLTGPVKTMEELAAFAKGMHETSD